jgi:catechol 2,3-dioxygenase-like lactoylglutathione lyase family enzyme
MPQTSAGSKLEHVNLTATDIERSASFFERLLGWRRRWQGPAMNGGETIHLGDEHAYLAFYTDRRPHSEQPKGAPLNHVGLLVADLARAERIVAEAGLRPFNHGDYAPGRRFYFLDWDGIEFEVVSYE